MKAVELLFYSSTPSATNIGLKIVLWEVNNGAVLHDWGFAFWDGTDWENIETPEGVTASVVRWANTLDPAFVLNDSRIIKMGE